MKLELNIGLWVNGVTGNIGPRTVLSDIQYIIGPICAISKVIPAKSGEPTLAINMLARDDINLERCMHELCRLLSQDCIAGKADDVGFLIGPNTAPYGDTFNPDHFLSL